MTPAVAAIAMLAAACSAADTTGVDVVDPGVKPWLEEDFSTYSSTEQLLEDPRNIYFWDDLSPHRISLDKSIGYGSSTQSMRYTFPDRTGDTFYSSGQKDLSGSFTPGEAVTWYQSDGVTVRGAGTLRAIGSGWFQHEAEYTGSLARTGDLVRNAAGARFTVTANVDRMERCKSYSISRLIEAPTYTSKVNGLRELWVESFVRFEETFSAKAPSEWGCTSAASLKLMFGLVLGSGRFDLQADVFGGWHWQYDASSGKAGPKWADGKWHRVRTHYKVASPGKADGEYRVWLDDLLFHEATGLTSPTGDLYGVRLGANLNQGPGAEMSYWWGAVRLYNTDPGWQ